MVDRGGRLVGLIDLTDLIGLLPSDFGFEAESEALPGDAA